jgi:hypothetical protein
MFSEEKAPMKQLTEHQKQWLWFLVLWCGGAAATMLLAYGVRWLIGN